MFIRITFFLSLFLFLSDQAGNASSENNSQETKLDIQKIEQTIFSEMNRQRILYGIKPLKNNPTLDTLARQHSRDMVERNFFSHTNPDKQTPAERAVKLGFGKKLLSPNRYLVGVAENIGKLPIGIISNKKNTFVENTPESIAQNQVKMWMSSPSHKKNILNTQFEEVGTGSAFDGKYYISTQNFR